MPRNPSSRKFQLTINNPLDHGFNHDRIKTILSEFPGTVYWCMCDEIGEQQTPHTHVYVVFKNSVMFDTIHRKFYGVHIERAKGSHRENRDYIRKEGKYLNDPKHDTSLIDTFEEFGELPPDKSRGETQAEQIMQLVKAGKTNAEILETCPTAYSKLHHIEQARQTLLEERYKNEWRDLEVTYIWGESGVGKTRSVMEMYGYSSVYRVTDYSHPFDSYKGQDVIIFEEFRSGLTVADMLNYLDGYPVELPCRYSNKVACYTKVYIITNIPLEQQYPNVQVDSPGTWNAFLRRIHHKMHMTNEYTLLEDDPNFNADEIFCQTEVP